VLSDAIRETDIVARFGGEEFVVVMPQTDLPGAVIFAERVRRKVEIDLSVTISGGMAQARKEDNSNTLLSRADAALYGAKAAGRNRCYIQTGSNVKPCDYLQLAKVE
jgi:diguanylate cyclase (GGDEF)-like protein